MRAKLPKVNALAAARFIQQDGPPRGADEEEGGGGGKRRKAANPMADDRFKVPSPQGLRACQGLRGGKG